MTLKTLALIFAAGAAASVAVLPAQAAPALANGIAQTDEANPLLDKVQHRVFVSHGRPYCFYFDGWHGAGWYRCGWNWRRGLGWGGVYGWNDWEYGPAARRFGSHRYGSRGGSWGGHQYSGQRGMQVQSPAGGTRPTRGFNTGAPRSGGTMSAPAPSGGTNTRAGGGGGAAISGGGGGGAAVGGGGGGGAGGGGGGGGSSVGSGPAQR